MAPRLTASSVPPVADAAGTVLRLAVLLQAGATPVRAWGLLAESGDVAAAKVLSAVHAGMPLSNAIAGLAERPASPPRGLRRFARPREAPGDGREAWRDVADAWSIATTVGAPLADSLRGLASALRDAHEAGDEVRVALAEPMATARLMSWLPAVGLLLGAAFGFDTLSALTATPLGAACIAGGIALTVAARRWNRALVRRASADRTVPGMDADLLAIALSGGVSIDRARRLVADSRAAAGGGGEPGGPAEPDGSDESARVLELSQRAGVPAVELLRASAALARHRARTDGRLRAAALASKLLVPLGVCTLPAFLLLGVAPMMLGVLGAVPLDL